MATEHALQQLLPVPEGCFLVRADSGTRALKRPLVSAHSGKLPYVQVCPSCHRRWDRDFNAARNMADIALALVEGAPIPPAFQRPSWRRRYRLRRRPKRRRVQ